MTLPNLVDNYYKSVAETRLKKFYSIFNQAIVLSEAKNGPKEYWFREVAGVEHDDEGNAVIETSELDKWFSTYLEQFVVIKKKIEKSGKVIYYLNDGSQFLIGSPLGDGQSNRDYAYYPFGSYDTCTMTKANTGRCLFLFSFFPISKDDKWKYHYQKGFEPYKFDWNGNYNSLFTHSSYGCNDNGGGGHYCTAIIQLNGWKVPKNYPKKIHP